jgi:hypothetical protein
MSLSKDDFLAVVNDQNKTFQDVLDVIREHYYVRPLAFEIGKVQSSVGENVGSLMIFSVAVELRLNKTETLKSFKEHYTYCMDQNDDKHQNIRALITGTLNDFKPEHQVIFLKKLLHNSIKQHYLYYVKKETKPTSLLSFNTELVLIRELNDCGEIDLEEKNNDSTTDEFILQSQALLKLPEAA